MELLIYGNNRQLSGIVESYEYFRWTRRYSHVGSFELKAIAVPENLALLKEGSILQKPGDNEAGIIERVELSQTDREMITASGRFATGLLSRRIVWQTETLSGDLSACVRKLLENNLLNPADPDRRIPGFAYAASNLGVSVSSQISYKNLMEAVCDLCDASAVGVKTLFNPATGLFTVTLYAGGSASAVFSKEYENLTEQTYIQSVDEYANTALVGGEGEGSERQFVTIIQGTGENRREVFVDAKDLQSADFPNTYNDALLFRGQSRLSELAPRYSFDAGVNPHGNLRYKTDFDLGNSVKVIAKPWGVAMTARITEIEETYDADGLTLGIIFGKSELTLAQKMRSDMSDMKTSLLAPSGGGSGDIPDASVTAAKLAADAVTTEKIAAAAVTAAEVADNAVTGAKIAAGAVGTDKIADNAVTSAKIADGAVSTADLADLAVTAAKIANSTITSGKLASGAVATANLADGAVTSGKLAAGAVGTDKIADNAVTSAKIADGAVATADLADLAVTATKIANSTITSGKIASSGVATANIADLAVTAAKIANSTITSGKIASSGVATANIADLAVTAAKIANSTITSGKIASSGVASGNIASGAVTMAKISSSSVSDSSFTYSTGSGVTVNMTNCVCYNTVVHLYIRVNITSGIASGGTVMTVTNSSFQPPVALSFNIISMSATVAGFRGNISTSGVISNGNSGVTGTGYFDIAVTYSRKN